MSTIEHNDKSGRDAVKFRKMLVPAEALRLSELGQEKRMGSF